MQYVSAQVADNTLPQNGNTVGGAANFNYQNNRLDVYQSTDRVVIDWDSFHIGKAASVEFFQPGSGSIAVNRVIQGVDPTQIMGSLKANGTVMVLDPNGVVFGQDSRVDVGGIVASTGDIDTAAFMNGMDILQLDNIDTDGAIVLNGQITIAEAGLAAFVAPTLRNNGVITAKMGRVAMASGEKATLDFYGDGLIEIAADDALKDALLENAGTIEAQGGVVQLSVPMAQKAVDNLINVEGLIDVSSATQEGGIIVLEGGNVLLSGTLKADGKTGGGKILVGGDYQGKGDTLNAQNTLVTAEALLSANATNHGDGGKIIIWADQNTGFAGNIEAKGGPDGGNGGFVEVSGKEYLDFRGDVDLSGDVLGELLLDPDDIDIVAGVANPGEFADDFITFAENGGGTSILGADTLSGRLSANANVTLQANNTIDVDAAITSTGSGDLTLETGTGGIITVNNAIDVNTGDLTLIADEIDIFAALSGSGDIQLTSADVSQEIEIGSTDATDLNLTAIELGFLQDGWDQITIGGTDHLAITTVSEAISFSDNVFFSQDNAGANTLVDVNAAITTTDNSDLRIFGRSNGCSGGPHNCVGAHISGDLNVARDLILDSSASTQIVTSQVYVGRDYIGTTGPNITIDADMTVGGDFSQTLNGQHFTIATGKTLDVGGDLSVTTGTSPSTSFNMNANSILEVDGDITIESQRVALATTASISGNVDGSSNITFLEAGQDEAMELGGTFAGHNWQMVAAEIATIQDGFNSITFGSGTYTEAIDITGAVSFSDNVSFLNTGGDATITVQDTLTTLDSANATLESGSASAVGWDAINVDADLNIAGNLITRTGTGPGSGHIQIDNTNIIVGGNWNLLSDNNGTVNTTNISVGGNLIAERGSSGLAPYTLNTSVANVTGDLNIDAGRNIRLFGDFTVGGNVILTNDSTGYDININDSLSSGGTIDLSATRNVAISDNLTSNGGITIGADNDSDQNGAISISGATITTNSGDFVAGGGANPLTTAAHAGDDATYDIGVLITGGSDINTGTGDILIRGEGEDTGTRNEGVRVENNSTLTTTSGDISIYGQGGNGTDLNRGIMINDTNTLITTTSGNILLDGAGGNGSSSDNYGIQVAGGAEITSTGMGAGVGTITLDGTGGDGTSDNYGVHLLDDTTQITSVDGAISLDGTGGRAASGDDNHGIHFHDGADVLSTGTMANAATISLTGLAGDGGSEAVFINGGTVVSGYGDISITGTDDATSNGRGVFISNFDTTASATRIESTGTGSNAADITINGTSDSNNGVFLHAGGQVQTVDGDVNVTGTGVTGVYVRFSSYFRSTGTGSNAGNITINGTGINGNGNMNGVWLAHSSDFQTVDGDLHVMGLGGDSNNAEGHGIVIGDGAGTTPGDMISQGDGNITLDGTAGDCTLGNCHGVFFRAGSGTENHIQTTATGNIDITGRGGNIGSDNYGIFLEGGSFIESTAIGADAGTITLDGTGGAGDDNNHGVYTDDDGTLVTSVDGDISITGSGGSNGSVGSNSNHGVLIADNSDVTSTGTGGLAANITLDGTGASGDSNNYGVRVGGANAKVISDDGDITVVARGGNGSGVNNEGYNSSSGGELRTTGSGSDAGNVRLTAIAGTGGNAIGFNASGSRLRTLDGDITVVAQGTYYSNGFNPGVRALGTDANISITADDIVINTANIQATGDLMIRNRTAGTSIGLGGGAGDLNIDDAELAQFTVGGKLTVGSSNAGLVTIDSVDLTAGAYATDIIGRDIVVENGLDVGSAVYLRSTQGDIQLNSGTVSAAGGGSSLVLNAARDFINNAGSAALDAGIGGRFLVYASDFETSFRGDILANVIEGETFASLPPASVPPGDRFIFARNPFTEITGAITAQIQNFVAKDINVRTEKDRSANKARNRDEVLTLETQDDQTLIIDGVSCDSYGSNASSCVLN